MAKIILTSYVHSTSRYHIVRELHFPAVTHPRETIFSFCTAPVSLEFISSQFKICLTSFSDRSLVVYNISLQTFQLSCSQNSIFIRDFEKQHITQPVIFSVVKLKYQGFRKTTYNTTATTFSSLYHPNHTFGCTITPTFSILTHPF